MNQLLSLPRQYKGHSWSKWGGGRTLPQDDRLWYCQKCGKPQVKELRTFLEKMFDDTNEYRQVCHECAPEVTKTFIVVENTKVTIQ